VDGVSILHLGLNVQTLGKLMPKRNFIIFMQDLPLGIDLIINRVIYYLLTQQVVLEDNIPLYY